MKWIGAHVSTAGGVENAPLNAADIGANAFALFTKNQRQWHAPQLTEENINSFRKNCKTFDYEPEQILPHDSYLINLGHPDQSKLQKSRMAFLEELQRCEQLGLVYLNFHPGTSLNLINAETCLDLIAESINLALAETKSITAVVENTAGQGASVGYNFQQLAYLISQVKDHHRIGICLDTCHLYAAGYDLKTQHGFTRTFSEFEEFIGWKYLKGMHLNDSKKSLGSRVDRHASLGKGEMGIEPFRRIMQDDRFNRMPLILETPDSEIWADEIEMLYGLC